VKQANDAHFVVTDLIEQSIRVDKHFTDRRIPNLRYDPTAVRELIQRFGDAEDNIQNLGGSLRRILCNVAQDRIEAITGPLCPGYSS